MVLRLLKWLFNLAVLLLVLSVVGLWGLWEHLKDRPQTFTYCYKNEAYQFEAQGLSWQWGEQRMLRLTVERLTMTPEENCEPQEESSWRALAVAALDWAEVRITRTELGETAINDLLLWSSAHMDPIFARARYPLEIEGIDPIDVAISAHYSKGHRQLRASGPLAFDFDWDPNNNFRLSQLSMIEPDLWELRIPETSGVWDGEILSEAHGSVVLSLLGSKPVELSYHYVPPRLEVVQNQRNVAEAHVGPESLNASGLVKFQNFSVPFVGKGYKFRQAEWRDLSYDWQTGIGQVRFNNIKMRGLIPFTISEVYCEGSLSDESGVCRVGQVEGPEGIEVEGMEVVISGFNDLMGTFQGTIIPTKIIPMKIPFLDKFLIQGNFVHKDGEQSIHIDPLLPQEGPVGQSQWRYTEKPDLQSHWVLHSSWESEPLLCQGDSFSRAECFFGAHALPEERWSFEADFQNNQVQVTLPEDLSQSSQIAVLTFEALDPTMWRLEAFSPSKKVLGSAEVCWDDGPHDLTVVEAQLWSPPFQGVAHWEDRQWRITAQHCDGDLFWMIKKFAAQHHLEKLFPPQEAETRTQQISGDFQHLVAAKKEWDKVHLSYRQEQIDGEQRWTIVHPAFRAQLSEQPQLGLKEGVVYIDKLSGLAPLAPIFEQVSKGQVVANYYQNAHNPQRDHFYLSGSDIFVHGMACRELRLLDILSGYAFSPQQVQAFATNGWPINRVTMQGYWEDRVAHIDKIFVQSGATSFEAKGTYDADNDCLALDLRVQPKVSSALTPIGALFGPMGAGLTFAGTHLFGEEVDHFHEKKWKIRGTLSGPEVHPWEADVIDYELSSDAKNVAKRAVVLGASDRYEDLSRES